MNSATRRRNSSFSSGTQPGWWKTESSSRCGMCSAALIAAPRVVLPDPLLPTTDTRSTSFSMGAPARDSTGDKSEAADAGLARPGPIPGCLPEADAGHALDRADPGLRGTGEPGFYP